MKMADCRAGRDLVDNAIRTWGGHVLFSYDDSGNRQAAALLIRAFDKLSGRTDPPRRHVAHRHPKLAAAADLRRHIKRISDAVAHRALVRVWGNAKQAAGIRFLQDFAVITEQDDLDLDVSGAPPIGLIRESQIVRIEIDKRTQLEPALRLVDKESGQAHRAIG